MGRSVINFIPDDDLAFVEAASAAVRRQPLDVWGEASCREEVRAELARTYPDVDVESHPPARVEEIYADEVRWTIRRDG